MVKWLSMKPYAFISIDFQNEFGTEGGKFYTSKPSVTFLKETLFPLLKEKEIKINEIISDNRSPRHGHRGDGCVPGTWGYESIIPTDLQKSLWIKSANSPLWTRDNAGDPANEATEPYPAPEKFGKWLDENVGKVGEVIPVLIGLTADCCVLSTAQELDWRGYKPLVLREAVDHASGKIEDRDQVLKSPVSNWADIIDWEELKKNL